MKTPRLVRTISFRLTVMYAVLFAASTLVLFGFVYWIATASLRDQLRLSLQTEMDLLAAEGPAGATGEIAKRIDQRLSATGARQFFYRLEDPSGHLIAGNLRSEAKFMGWRMLPHADECRLCAEPSGDEADHGLLAFARTLPDGGRLTVAIDTFRLDEAEELIIRAFGWAAAVTLLLGAGGGIALSQGFLGRIDIINRTARAIMSGDLSERIRVRGTGDELDQLGRNLNDMLDRLESLMGDLKQVSNDIAHDLRTPLSRLRQRLEAVRIDGRSVADYEQGVDEAMAEADNALAIFGALLRIAQIGSGARRAKFARLDLSALMSSLAMTYSAVAEDAGKRLTSSVEPGLHIRGDRELLTQLFVNLIENALRHTPAVAQIHVSLKRVAGHPVAEVADSGPGIPAGERKNVFKRFYRLETSRSTPGSGLGLALAAAVANLHHAKIALTDNAPGLKVTLGFEAEHRK